MKAIKKIISILAIAALMVILPTGHSMVVSAAGGTTFYVFYDNTEKVWRYIYGNHADEEAESYTLSQLINTDLKDGDLIVMGGDLLPIDNPIVFGKHLQNLTIMPYCTGSPIVYANGIDECYVCNNVTAIVHSDVTNAYLYDGSVANFDGNVQNLTITDSSSEITATANVTGTVAHLSAVADGHPEWDYYNFKANTLSVKNGEVTTAVANYSTTPSAPETTPKNPSNGSGEYDDVPKTGERSVSVWFFAAATICFAASFLLRRKEK